MRIGVAVDEVFVLVNTAFHVKNCFVAEAFVAYETIVLVVLSYCNRMVEQNSFPPK